jgi:Ser/Thr protein kinase RdoA (MazF antagonist)
VPRLISLFQDKALPLLEDVTATLLHGDYGSGNLFFGGPECGYELAVFDWGTMLRGPGVVDVVFLLTRSLESKDRSSWESDALREYHRVLQTSGVVGYRLDELRSDHRLALLSLALRAIIVGGVLDMPNEKAMAILRTRQQRMWSAILEGWPE